MPPKKQDLKKDSAEPFKLKTAGASGMPQFTISNADRFQLFLSQVNQPDPVTGNPHPNKVELDKVRKEYMDWYTPVDLTDLETAYYGLLFSTGQVYSGANQITKQFENLVEQREPDSFLEFYKLVIMGNWLVKNNRLDVTSYSKLTTALSTIPPGSYVVCKGDVTDMLDLHSSMCYLNDLLHKYDPTEYDTNLLPNDCPALAELPRTQGSIMDEQAAALDEQAAALDEKAAEQARLNNMARAAALKSTRGYAMAAAKPAEPAAVKRHPTQRYTQVRKLTPKEKLKRKIEAGRARKQAEKASAAEEAQKLAEAETKQQEEAEEAEEALKEAKAIAVANNMSKTASKKAINNKLTRSEKRTEKRIAKSIKKSRKSDLDNLKLLISRIAANANKKLTDMLLDAHGHLLHDTELVEEYLTSVHSGEDEREHHREVIDDAKGLLNKLIQSRKTVASPNTQSSAQPSVVVVRKTPEPANNAPKTIPEAAEVLSNSYETGSEEEEEEVDMTGLERPVYSLRQGKASGSIKPKIRSTKKANNVSTAKAERAMSSKARNKSKSVKRSSKKGPSDN